MKEQIPPDATGTRQHTRDQALLPVLWKQMKSKLLDYIYDKTDTSQHTEDQSEETKEEQRTSYKYTYATQTVPSIKDATLFQLKKQVNINSSKEYNGKTISTYPPPGGPPSLPNMQPQVASGPPPPPNMQPKVASGPPHSTNTALEETQPKTTQQPQAVSESSLSTPAPGEIQQTTALGETHDQGDRSQYHNKRFRSRVHPFQGNTFAERYHQIFADA